jgi:hypothetical protein
MGTTPTYFWILLVLTKKNGVCWRQRSGVEGGMTYAE